MFTRPASRRSRLLAGLGLSLALSLPVGAAVAAPSEHISGHRAVLQCPDLRTDAASGDLHASASDQVDAFAHLNLYVAPNQPPFDPPTFVAGVADLTLSSDDSSLTGSIELVSFETGESAYTALLAAALTPSGPPETIERRSEGGNRKHRMTETIQPMAVTGSFSVPAAGGDLVFSLEGCFAEIVDMASFENAPNSTVESGELLALQCIWERADLYVRFEAAVDTGLSFADIAVITPEAGFTGADESASFSRSALRTTLPLHQAGQGLIDGGGIATVSASLAAQDVVTWLVKAQDSRLKARSVPLSVNGELHIALDDGSEYGLAMTDDVCRAFDRSFREIKISRQGGNTRAVTNDTPGTAEPISVGRGTNAHTGGAAFEGEATTDCLFLGEDFILNLAHSAWYRVVGTGAPVTIDTGGSDFDTVVAVYTEEAGRLTEVACNDDQVLEPMGVSSQAKLTFDTEAGTVYLIQVGGYGSEWGHLKLRLH